MVQCFATIQSNLQHECQAQATQVQHDQHECDTSATLATRLRHKCDTSATRVENFDFDSGMSKNTFLPPCIYYMASEWLQGEEQFHSKHYLLEIPCFNAKMRLKRAPQN